MRVVVVGGGIGGLALGSGLRRNGFDVEVVDRDIDVRATGGYHITLDDRALAALGRLVQPQIVRRLSASGSALRHREPDAFWDRRGRFLGHGADLSGSASVDVDRITLRALLAEAVGPDLRLGRTVTGVGLDGDGRPRVGFADGTSVTADLVVGADGAHSLVARHLAGAPTNHPVGIIGFSGRTRRADLGAAESERLGPRSSMAVGPRGAALYIGFLDPVGNAALDAPELRMSVTTGPTYIWGAMFPEGAGTRALRGLRGEQLRAALLDRFRDRGWDDRFLEVVALADPTGIGSFRFRAASTRAAELAPWPAGSITALGDAVHATPPTAGMGAGAAIRDAADLLDQLGAVAEDAVPLTDAIGRFEAGMRERGSEVLALAMRTVRGIRATDTVLGAAATALATPILAAVARSSR
ncbi:2-polyprenyl-6-methoxyphenol hydroxylase-like FAD-dependent oxidoreductase [Pseudonocardia autotrophica]|uniref:6-hydroxynicotinate 3-monooxygenase n=2 Tax=Pseudonocardia TaxID=1847 RepID=A0A1Y2MKJ6_PSEAH|nr:6-hydroxynicotinate 3-monooxygenase precursor [Pseudonocardia autotrophica]TDN75708.1 2-polyprenyl-6-methoxyphenol hydroxylase-like FAD-dependent oxidoreductase [Pseudonocardia autotrophica]BBF99677.1 monooxygenase [Pseudonocardia autotrophica]